MSGILPKKPPRDGIDDRDDKMEITMPGNYSNIDRRKENGNG
jgi:hypothetical protein